MSQRPNLNTAISTKDFQEFYWLKEELTTFCRAEGLKTTGSKIEMTQRIITYLNTGEKQVTPLNTKKKTTSKFDWNSEKLTLNTVITDNYKNTENVRAFYTQQIGNQFKFNVKFMNWMKSNVGKTLKEAIEAWKTIDVQNKTNTKPKEIAPQFEYNTYLRDFLAHNPGLGRNVGIKLWKIKKSMRGNNKYSNEDLNWINEE